MTGNDDGFSGARLKLLGDGSRLPFLTGGFLTGILCWDSLLGFLALWEWSWRQPVNGPNDFGCRSLAHVSIHLSSFLLISASEFGHLSISRSLALSFNRCPVPFHDAGIYWIGFSCHSMPTRPEPNFIGAQWKWLDWSCEQVAMRTHQLIGVSRLILMVALL